MAPLLRASSLLLALLIVPLGLTSCVFSDFVDPAVPHAIGCASAEDCPPDWVCREALSACVAADSIDGEAPTFIGRAVIEPAAVSVGRPLRVSFEVSEPLARDPNVVLVDAARPLAMALVEAAAPRFTYDYVPTGDEAEGGVAVLVDLVDVGGDARFGVLAGTATLDFTAPSVLAGSVSIAIVPPPPSLGSLTDTLVPGGLLDVSFVVDDDSAITTATLRHADTAEEVDVPGQATVLDPSTRGFSLFIPPLTPGPWQLFTHLVDPAGNATTAPLGLLNAAAVVPSPCVARDPLGAPVCTDADDDGHFGASAACNIVSDCNDDDPLSFPGAIEIPGDGADNDCAGDGDALPVEGIFVAPTGDDAAGGTADDPLRTLRAALSLAELFGVPFVFLAEGDYDAELGLVTSRDLVGGFDPSFTTRSGTSNIRFAALSPCDTPLDGLEIVAPARIIDRVTFSAPCAKVMLDVITDGRFFLRDVVVTVQQGTGIATRQDNGVRMTSSAVTVEECCQPALRGQGELYVFNSAVAAVADALFIEGSATVARSTVTGQIDVDTNGVLGLIGSVYFATVDGPSVGDLAVVEIIQSTIMVANPGFHVFAYFAAVTGGELRLANTAIVGGDHVIELNDPVTEPSIVVDNVNLFDACLVHDAGQCFDEQTIASCAFPGCVRVNALTAFDPLLNADGRPAAASPLAGAGAAVDGAPTMLAVDLDGRCRDTFAPDIGAYVVR